jgi:hypothetical protein
MKSFMKRRIAGLRLSHGRIAGAAAALAFVLLSAACGDASGPEQLATLTISPVTATVAVNGTVQFSAAGTRTGSPETRIEGEVWSVTGGGTVNDAGMFTAGNTPGTSTVTVACGGRTAVATVTVTAGPLASITVTPNPATLGVGAQQQFTAVGRDAAGNVVAITPVWSTTDPPGTINAATGLFTAGNTLGTFANSVRATSGAIFGTATVNVTAGPLATITVTPNPVTLPIGGQQQFTAVGHDAGGNVVAITPVWSTTSPPGTIDATTGLFTAGNTVGGFPNSVRATSGAIFGTATVNVVPGPLATITVTPNPETLAVGAQQQFTAVGRDAAGNVIAITPTWSTTNPPGTINAGSGLFTAGNTAGTFPNSVRATEGSIFGTATVTVTAAAPGPLATITVTPNPRTLETGDQQTFTAVGRDANGVVIPINPTWSVTNGGGTVPAGSTGQTVVFTAGNSTGTFTNTVRATQGAIFGRATVIVTAQPVVPPPPPPPSTFRVLALTAVACTSGSISGDVGTFQAGPTGSFTGVNCPVNGGTVQIGTAASIQAYNSFVAAYNARETVPCGTVLTGTLAGVTLPPGVYCFDNAATLTGVLTLNGPSNGTWLFKVGTSGVGSLTATGLSVVMAGNASSCNVTWWVEDAATTTDSNFLGAILAGSDLTTTRGTLQGNAWSQGDVTITDTVLSACVP